MLFKQSIPNIPLRSWLLMEKDNRILFYISVLFILVQFIIFKFLYPYPNFVSPDSDFYIKAATNNRNLNIYAIGYSKFLRLFSSFTSSHLALVWFQYLLLEASLLYFLFSIRYLLSPGKWAFRILLGLSIFNPLVPQLSNLIANDALFCALSLIWITQLFWFFKKPEMHSFFLHALSLLLLLLISYNAIYYPLISIIAIFMAHIKPRFKWIAVSTIIVSFSALVFFTEYSYHEETGDRQFYSFNGWQLASNALYGYSHSTQDSAAMVPPKFRKLHALVNHHMDSLSRIFFFFRPDYNLGSYYIWNLKSPLQLYMKGECVKDTSDLYIKQWATLAPLFSSYGQYLITHHPGPFIKSYIEPNIVRYYVPPSSPIDSYNSGKDTVDAATTYFFGWNSNKIYKRFKDTKIKIVIFISVALGVINFTFLAILLAFTILGAFRSIYWPAKRIIQFTVIFWLSNMLFSVVAAPVELRQQLFSMLVTLVFLGLLLSYLVNESQILSPQNKNNEPPIYST